MKLAIIVGTVRDGRKTERLAAWVAARAQERGEVEVEVLDLQEYKLPFFTEPVSPRYNPDRQPSGIVKDWLDALTRADAYIVVTPEYNHSIPGVLKNAFDYVDFQMERKPSAIVSHGVVGGARAAMHLKEILSESHTVPIQKFVAFAGLNGAIDESGNLSPDVAAQTYGPQADLDGLLDDLTWYSDALSAARASN